MAWLCVIETQYTTYGLADTPSKARSIAIRSAQKFIEKSGFPMTLDTIESNLSINVYEVPMNGAIQAGLQS